MIFEELKRYSEEVFMRHWDFLSLKKIPLWSAEWNFSDEIPFENKRGSIALLKDDHVIDIISVIGDKETLYTCGNIQECIENKILDGNRKLKKEYKGITALSVLPFEDNEMQLIPALEVFITKKFKKK